MSIKKIVLAGLMVLILIGSLSLPSYAAPEWYNVTVKQIGPAGNGGIYVLLSDNGGHFTNKWFVCLPTTALANRQMAVLLTAMTNSLTVQIWADADDAITENRVIVNMYMYAS